MISKERFLSIKTVYKDRELEDSQKYGRFPELDALVDSQLETDRLYAAYLGYGLDKLKDDTSEKVRAVIASNQYFLSQFIKDSSVLVQKEVKQYIQG